MARTFDGVNDSIAIANESNFDFERTSTFSVTAWVRPNGKRSGGEVAYAIASKLNSAAPNEGWEFIWSWNPDGADAAARLKVFLVNTFGLNYISLRATTTDLTNGTWWHVGMTYSGSSTGAGVKLYVNGALESQVVSADTLSASMLNNLQLRVGSRNAANTFLKGDLAAVHVYNVELTQTEVQMVMRESLPRPSAHRLWMSLFGTVSPEPDWSGLGNNGTLTGTVRIDHPPGISAVWLAPHPRRVQVVPAAAAVDKPPAPTVVLWAVGRSFTWSLLGGLWTLYMSRATQSLPLRLVLRLF